MNHSPQLAAILLSLGLIAGAQAQTTGGTPQQQAQAKPSGPSYGPVLHPQPAPSAQTGAEARPQAQEERAGAAAQQPQRQLEVDPSARPSPQPVQPEPAKQDKKDAKEKAKPKPKAEPRRNVQQRVEPMPRIAAPSAHPYGRVADPAVGHPAPVVPAPAQVTGCTGGVCHDSSGTSYNLGSGNTGVSSDGKLCTRSGNTMQCL